MTSLPTRVKTPPFMVAITGRRGVDVPWYDDLQPIVREQSIAENWRPVELQEHLEAIEQLKREQATEQGAADWPPGGFYLLWHVVIGMMLGGIGALVSLAFNAIGATLVGKPALELIRVYLTFPMGEEAMTLHPGDDHGVVLFIGCCLYLVTGALYGVVFHLVMTWFFVKSSVLVRFIAATAMGIGLWLVNFYGVLSWLQPALQNGSWILDEIPIWVAALTHLAFAWTMLLVSFWGRFETSAATGRAPAPA